VTAPSSIDPARFLHDQLESASPDLLRSMLTTFVNTLMSAEADAICGAPYGAPSPERVNVRNDYRHRDFDTRAGTLDVALPKLRSGSYFPDWLLERRRRAEAALTTVVSTCYLLGVSTRRMKKLVESLGITRLSRSQASVMAAELDAAVEDFRTRPPDAGPYTFVAADALVLKVREGGRVVNVHALLATGVNADGHREILGLQVTSAEDGAGWLAFFRELTARGLAGVALVTSDVHRGLTEAIGATVPGASRQRCRTHWSRKGSTCRFRYVGAIGLPRDRGEERGGCGIPRRGSGDVASVLFQQGADPCGGVADSAPAYLEQLGYDVPGAYFAQAEDDRQDALGVGDLLGEDAATSSGQPVTAPALMIASFGLGGLAEGEPPCQLCQVLPAHPGQRRIAQCRQPVRPGRRGSGSQEVPERARAGEPQDGGHDRVLALGQQPAGLGDRLSDGVLVDLEHLRQHQLGAGLALVDNLLAGSAASQKSGRKP
jgi:putative transposase